MAADREDLDALRAALAAAEAWAQAAETKAASAVAEATRAQAVLTSTEAVITALELAFAKLKALLRSAAARTVDVLWHTIGQLLDAFGPTECAHYLAHAGYVPPDRERL